jgi:hypothetical protein
LVKPSKKRSGIIGRAWRLELVSVENDERTFPENARTINAPQETSSDILLKAHENLMEILKKQREI